MYTPAYNRITTVEECHRVMRENGFATLVSTAADGTFLVTHVPLLLEARGPNGILVGHLAKANPHAKALVAGRPTIAIFQGPHSYVSAAAYRTPQDVPTWNYLAVHAHGTPRAMSADKVRAHLGQLVHKYEGSRAQPWSLDAAGEDYIAQEAKGIVAFEMPIDRLEGKAKMSQNREPEDREGVLRLLRREGKTDQLAVADAMEHFPPKTGAQPKP